MFNKCKDTFTVCKYFGYPNFFVTVTCNPEWNEIKKLLKRTGLRADDRPNIISRVFEIKLNQLIKDFKDDGCTIEFQKRGLLHSHILLFMHLIFKPKSADDIDRLISAEILDKSIRPKLYATAEKFMVHGPCGFPKYKRLDNCKTIRKKNVILDNSYIVPYNPSLLLKYGCHINVEHTCQTSAIKYLFKYVHKGNDRVTTFFYQTSEDENIEDVIRRTNEKLTKLQVWMIASRQYPYANSLTYIEFPIKFVWMDDISMWARRKQGFSIGRLTHVPRMNSEDYYLCLLLNIQKGCRSFSDLRTVEGILYSTYKEACYALGLLQDDKEFINAIIEASTWLSANYADFIDLQLTYEQIVNLTLAKIEEKMQENRRSFKEFNNMSYPSDEVIDGLDDHFMMDELNFDRISLKLELQRCLQTITDEQQNAFDKILNVVNSGIGGSSCVVMLLIKIGDRLTGDSTDGEYEVIIPEEILIDDNTSGFEKLFIWRLYMAVVVPDDLAIGDDHCRRLTGPQNHDWRDRNSKWVNMWSFGRYNTLQLEDGIVDFYPLPVYYSGTHSSTGITYEIAFRIYSKALV
ncbi:uncharacterized protein LOC107474714 [Arachis duranensis]|uniref:Uncharacterized protein LOC107474714 n=1 Tax=Arachis duranensis TaxID=130453 RepID=A0A9C6WQX4_ARADU|nr:uncharacterized protein LOC107474714 [Arachis duranensis]